MTCSEAVRQNAYRAKGILGVRRITIRRAAATIGVSELFLGRQLNGFDEPTPRVRAGLSALLDLPEDQLFDTPSDRRPAA